jgi:type I restriction enzyme S subunit
VDVRGPAGPARTTSVDDTALAALGDDPDDVIEEEDGDGEN